MLHGTGRWRIARRFGLVTLVALLTSLLCAESSFSAWCEQRYLAGYTEEVRTRQIEVPYREAVTREIPTTVYRYQIVGYRTAYRQESRTETRTLETPVWDYYIVHYNRWASGRVSSCVSYYDPPNCGSHGNGWVGHWSDYVWYVAYYTYRQYDQVVMVPVPYQEPIYEYVAVPSTTTVTEWVDRTRTMTETYSVTIPVYATRSVFCADPDEPAPAPAVTTYTLRYDPNGGTGSVPADVVFNAGTRVSLTSVGLQRDGYTFNGWMDSSGQLVSTVTMVADTTVRASWSAVANRTYTLRYDANGGTGDLPAASTHQAGSVVPLDRSSVPTRRGYRFLGWSASGSGNVITTISMGNDQVVYAVWQGNMKRPT